MTSRRLGRRLPQLFIGLTLYALSIALVVHSALGSMPWDVLSQGLSVQVGWSLGTAVLISSVAVLLCWIPLRQKPGVGTVANVLVIGVLIDPFVALLNLLPENLPLVARAAMLVAGILLNGVAGALYIGSRLGPGPRDGLMTGLVARTGGRVALIRGGIELTVVIGGWLLGGTVGVGTVLYALAIGPILQFLLPRFSVPLAGDTEPAGQEAAEGHQADPAQSTAPGVTTGAEPTVAKRATAVTTAPEPAEVALQGRHWAPTAE